MNEGDKVDLSMGYGVAKQASPTEYLEIRAKIRAPQVGAARMGRSRIYLST